MRKTMTVVLLACITALAGCEKCYRCTITGGTQTITEENCDKGKSIDAWVNSYENAGFECEEFKN